MVCNFPPEVRASRKVPAVQSRINMDTETGRYLVLLQELIDRSGTSMREIERRLGWSAGRLTKLLAGTNELRLRNFLEILRTINVDPWDYYRLVCGKTKLSEHVVHKLEVAKPKTEPVVLTPAISETELNRRIQEAVDRALDLRLKKPAPSGAAPRRP
jgi:transcriptional regulator with XRE-family HTH domain